MTKKEITLLLLAAATAVILQVSLFPLFLRPSFKPDLLLVIMVFIALRMPFETGAPLAWLLGLLEDVFSGLYLGLCAASFLITFLVIKSFSNRLYTDSALLFMLSVAGATLIGFTVNLLFLLMFTTYSGAAYAMIADILPRLLVNSFAASLFTLFPGFDSTVDVA